MIEIKVPEVGESIQEVQISRWLKQVGEFVARDENIVELETEKASVEVAASESGIVQKLELSEGDFANVGDVIAVLEPAEEGAAVTAPPAEESPAASRSANGDASVSAKHVMPAAQRVLDEYKITADKVTPTGKGARLLKEDVLKYIESNNLKPGGTARPSAPASKPASKPSSPPAASPALASSVDAAGDRAEERKPMSMIRRTIARRLVEAQQTAALLTTFNEVDMEPVMSLRSKYKEQFIQKHGVKLGFMSFFAKAAVEALRRFPAINAQIEGNEIVYRHYQDIGVAIGGGKGLVVPVLRNVEKLSFAQIERQIAEYGALAQDNKISPTDLQGGTFTISNGGIYGSLLSTPIVNPPQSGILGLHSIQDRPVAINGQVEVRPMMYLALTYDHRIVDGREAVMFLKTIKEVLEEPARLFLEI